MSAFQKSILALFVLFIVGVVVVLHSGLVPYAHNPLQYMPNMHRSEVLLPMRKGASQPVPEGTLGRSIKPYPYSSISAAADVPKFSNPLSKNSEIVLRGKEVFNTYCAVCHGVDGLGKGSIIPAFPQPPLLTSDKIRNYADSQIFHVLTVGQNVMSGYGTQIREQDRWAIVHYVRVLQRAQSPTAKDIEEFEKSGN